jgi:hypothetical protein
MQLHPKEAAAAAAAAAAPAVIFHKTYAILIDWMSVE